MKTYKVEKVYKIAGEFIQSKRDLAKLVNEIGGYGICPHLPNHKAIRVDIDLSFYTGNIEYINEEGCLVCENGYWYELEF